MQQGRAAPVRMLALPRWRINHLNQQEYIKLWSRHGDAIQPLAIKKNRSSMLAVVSQEEFMAGEGAWLSLTFMRMVPTVQGVQGSGAWRAEKWWEGSCPALPGTPCPLLPLAQLLSGAEPHQNCSLQPWRCPTASGSCCQDQELRGHKAHFPQL